MKTDIYSTGLYRAKNPTWHREDSEWKALKIAAMIRDSGLAIESIAEIGCGAGEVLSGVVNALEPRPKGCRGFDVSAEAISLARSKNNGPEITFVQGAPEGSYDLVLLIDVIEHVPDCFGFVSASAAHGGIICAHIPLALSAATVLRPSSIMSARRSVGHIHLFTAETALALFTDLGFEILDFRFTAGSIDLPTRSPRTLLARIPRKLLSAISTPVAARIIGGFSILILAKSPPQTSSHEEA